jgi:hypothetical protein
LVKETRDSVPFRIIVIFLSVILCLCVRLSYSDIRLPKCDVTSRNSAGYIQRRTFLLNELSMQSLRGSSKRVFRTDRIA